MFNPLKYFRNRKVGLALGSGGAKGVSHIAVIEYLESMGIPIDMIAGSSIGAVIGALYCFGTMRMFKDDLMNMTKRDLLGFFDPVFPRSGLLQGNGYMEFLEKYIPSETMIEDLPIPFAIVATDYTDGRTVVFRKGNLLEAIRASVSIPGIFQPVRYGNTFLLDGGVANPLPINVVKGMGAGMTIAVNLHPTVHKIRMKSEVKTRIDRMPIMVDSRDIEIIDEKKQLLDMSADDHELGWMKAVESWITSDKKTEKIKPPSIFEVIFQSIDIMEYTNTIMMLKYNTPSVLIEPDLPDIGTLDFIQVKKILTEGYRSSAAVRKYLLGKVKIGV